MTIRNKNGLRMGHYLAGIVVAFIIIAGFSDRLVFSQYEGNELKKEVIAQQKEVDQLSDTVSMMNRKLDRVIFLLERKEGDK